MAYSFLGGKFREIDSLTGLSLSGGLLYTYAAGTLTPLATFTDSGGLSANTNPVVLDSAGRADVFLGPSAYRMILKTSVGTTIWDEDNISAAQNSATALATLLASSAGSANVGFIGAKPSMAARTAQSKMRDIISVADYPGFDPTGVTETSTVINLATQSGAAFSAALAYDIFMPTGTFLLNGSVYIRSGQTLRGAGHGTYFVCTGTPAATPNFVLGSGSGGADGSGSPVEIRDFRTIGGGGTAGVIKSIQAGATIADIFMTSPGIGLDIQGADTLIYGVEIDQGLTGMLISGANHVITNCGIYLANYGIQLVSGAHDTAISNCKFEYSQYAAILYPTAATAIRAITVTGCNFTMNAQFGTFLGFIVMQASNSEVHAVGCSFRNMFNWAINHNTGVGNQLMFSGCIFDGTPTTSGYTSSTTAKVLNIPAAASSTYDFEGCQFRNLLGEIATLANGMTSLTFNGGQVVNCDANAASQKRFNLTGLTDWPKIMVKGLKGFPWINNTGAAQAIVLPYWGPSTIWKVAVKGNTISGSSGFYAAAEEAAYTVTYQFNGATQNTYVDKMLIWKTTTRALPGDLAAVACFGTAPGGAVLQAGIVQTGQICISVPVTLAANFDWYAETGT